MPEIFALEFMRRALLVGLVVSAVAPTIGIFFVVRRYSAMADTLAHVSLAGVAASLVAGTAAIPTALVVSVLSVLGIERLRERRVLPAETVLSLFLFGGLASGVVLLGFAHGRNASVMNYLFGSLVTVTRADAAMIAGIGGLVFLATLLLWRDLFTVSVDEDTAAAAGIPVRLMNRLLAVLGASAIAISMNVVGVLLIGALMVIPVLAAMQFRVGFRRTWILSLIVSAFSVTAGLALSYYLNLASGGTIVLSAIACFLLASLVAGKQGLVARGS